MCERERERKKGDPYVRERERRKKQDLYIKDLPRVGPRIPFSS